MPGLDCKAQPVEAARKPLTPDASHRHQRSSQLVTLAACLGQRSCPRAVDMARAYCTPNDGRCELAGAGIQLRLARAPASPSPRGAHGGLEEFCLALPVWRFSASCSTWRHYQRQTNRDLRGVPGAIEDSRAVEWWWRPGHRQPAPGRRRLGRRRTRPAANQRTVSHHVS